MPRLRLIAALFFALPAAIALAQLTPAEQAAQLESFETVWTTVRDHNPDAALNGLNWRAVHDAFEPRIRRANSAAEVREILREMIGKLGLSHYAIIPAGLYTATATQAPKSTPQSTPLTNKDAAAKAPAPDPAGANPPEPAAQSKPATQSQPVITSTAVQFGNLPGTHLEFETRTLAGGAGYIRFNEFLDPVTLMPRLAAALHDFAAAPGIVLDLRGNPGGLGLMAAGVAGFFVSESGHQLGEMKMNGTTLRFPVFPRAGAYTGKLAILLDAASASTTEIFAQGLQDLHRARIFGTRSAGAALPSDIIRLANGDGFEYPTASYTSVNGRILEGNGVIPDVEVSRTPASAVSGDDPVIDAAVAWLSQ